jgi:hypothetical protein
MPFFYILASAHGRWPGFGTLVSLIIDSPLSQRTALLGVLTHVLCYPRSYISWEVYRQHFRGHVIPWMERYRIGSLSPEDAAKAPNFKFGDMYETDPIRDPNNLPCTVKPWCGEPRIDLLTKDYITPNELFYVRNHLAVPDIEADEYRLIVKGKGIKKHTFTLKDLKEKFPKHEVVTTLQCKSYPSYPLSIHVLRLFSPTFVADWMQVPEIAVRIFITTVRKSSLLLTG